MEYFMKDKISKKINSIPTGLYDLDHKLNEGFYNGNLIVLAGRPSMGKTSLALNMAFNASKFFQEKSQDIGQSCTVAFISFESLPDQLMIPFLSMMTRIDMTSLKRARVTEEEQEIVAKAIAELKAMPLKIISLEPTIEDICSKARTLKEDNNLGILFIDYLQLITLEEGLKLSREKISYITARLKRLAIELEIPIILLSHVTKTLESRQNKRPTLVDLTDSASIAQDADVVMFVHREEVYWERQEPELDSLKYDEWFARMGELHNVLELSVAKNRGGFTGEMILSFIPKYCSIEFSDRTKYKAKI
jgi:replicative DNA helicase